MVGSPDVFTNDKPQARKDDIGIHAVCCGPNNYTINAGSSVGVTLTSSPTDSSRALDAFPLFTARLRRQ